MVGVSLGLFARLVLIGSGSRCLQRYPALNSPVKPGDFRADSGHMERSSIRRISTVAAVCGILLLPACSQDSYQSEVALEARWQCDVQRQAFAELGDINAEFDNRLASEGVTPDEYASFKAELEVSPQLRSEVLDAYDQYCLTADD